MVSGFYCFFSAAEVKIAAVTVAVAAAIAEEAAATGAAAVNRKKKALVKLFVKQHARQRVMRQTETIRKRIADAGEIFRTHLIRY